MHGWTQTRATPELGISERAHFVIMSLHATSLMGRKKTYVEWPEETSFYVHGLLAGCGRALAQGYNNMI